MTRDELNMNHHYYFCMPSVALIPRTKKLKLKKLKTNAGLAIIIIVIITRMTYFKREVQQFFSVQKVRCAVQNVNLCSPDLCSSK